MIIDDNHPDFYDLKNAIPKLMKLLMNKEFYFYGTFNNLFKIDDMVLEAIEDPDDGYRSHLGAICHYASKDDIVYQFHKRPLGRVELIAFQGNLQDLGLDTYGDEFNGYYLKDLDTSHIWLVIGTDNVNDYYPCFKFWYNPDKTQKDYVDFPKDYKPFTERYPELYMQAVQWFDGLKLTFRDY